MLSWDRIWPDSLQIRCWF